MPAFSDSQILQIWEMGQDRSLLERSLILVGMAHREQSREQLMNWTIGQRDAELLSLRELTFGPQLNSLTDCPQCEERLEFSFLAADIRMGTGDSTQQYRFEQMEYEIVFRVPTQADLMSLVPPPTQDLPLASSLALARQSAALLERCILAARYQGQAVTFADLPTDVLQALGIAMADCDPQAEVLINLSCADCGHEWQSLFDIVAFFWDELSGRSRQLLAEVHVLARFYGWREADILAMGTRRRQHYLERASQ